MELAQSKEDLKGNLGLAEGMYKGWVTDGGGYTLAEFAPSYKKNVSIAYMNMLLDASDTFNKCGMFPSELLAKITELETKLNTI